MNAKPASPDSKRIRVLCVDDSTDLVRLFSKMIDNEADLESAGGLLCADELVSEVARRSVDVVVIDLEMPGVSPFEAIGQLRLQSPECRVIICSGTTDAKSCAAATQLDAAGWVSKRGDPSELLRAIRNVSALG